MQSAPWCGTKEVDHFRLERGSLKLTALRSIKVYDVLFDTGALHKSYTRSKLVERNRN